MRVHEKGASLKENVNLKLTTGADFMREWRDDVWSKTPSKIVTLPFIGGVFVGFVSNDKTGRQAFLLAPEDAKIIGQQLLAKAAASEAMEEMQ